MTVDEILCEVHRLPDRSTLASELTARDRVALALAAGAAYTTELVGTMWQVVITDLVSITDRAGGGWNIVVKESK